MLLIAVLLFALSNCEFDGVPHITSIGYKEHFKDSPILVVYVYDEHVDRYKAGLRRFSEIVSDLKFDIEPKYMAINCASNHLICENNRFTKRPAVLFLKKGAAVETFTGDMNSYAFRSFLRSHLSTDTSVTNNTQFRVLLLIVILIALVLLFLKTIRSTYVDSVKADLEEQAPLVNRSPEQNAE